MASGGYGRHLVAEGVVLQVIKPCGAVNVGEGFRFRAHCYLPLEYPPR